MRVVNHLVRLLADTAPQGVEVAHQMTVTLGPRQRLEPDVLVARPGDPDDLTAMTFQPEDVLLVVEVESADSIVRDRGIRSYTATAVLRGPGSIVTEPFPMAIDPARLTA